MKQDIHGVIAQIKSNCNAFTNINKHSLQPSISVNVKITNCPYVGSNNLLTSHLVQISFHNTSKAWERITIVFVAYQTSYKKI